MRTLFSLLALILFLQSCDIFVTPEEPVKTEVQVSEINKKGTFTKIKASGATVLHIEKGKKHKIELKGNPKHFKYLAFEIEGNTLICSTREMNSSDLDVEIYLTLPEVSDIRISGASDIEMGPFGQLYALEIHLSGAGNFETFGEKTKLNNLDISISGAGSVEAFDLISSKVDVSVSGAGSAEVYAKQSLEASVSGVGSIVYKGNPKVSKRVSGIGSISKN